jgi:hypothetical protein
MTMEDELIQAMVGAWRCAPLPPPGSSFAEDDIAAMRAVLAVVREHDKDGERLREALFTYGRHSDSCGDADAYNGAEEWTCSCGLDDAIVARVMGKDAG